MLELCIFQKMFRVRFFLDGSINTLERDWGKTKPGFVLSTKNPREAVVVVHDSRHVRAAPADTVAGEDDHSLAPASVRVSWLPPPSVYEARSHSRVVSHFYFVLSHYNHWQATCWFVIGLGLFF